MSACVKTTLCPRRAGSSGNPSSWLKDASSAKGLDARSHGIDNEVGHHLELVIFSHVQRECRKLDAAKRARWVCRKVGMGIRLPRSGRGEFWPRRRALAHTPWRPTAVGSSGCWFEAWRLGLWHRTATSLGRGRQSRHRACRGCPAVTEWMLVSSRPRTIRLGRRLTRSVTQPDGTGRIGSTTRGSCQLVGLPVRQHLFPSRFVIISRSASLGAGGAVPL